MDATASLEFDVVMAPDVTVGSSAGDFTEGVPGSYDVTVTNEGDVPTSGTITVTDTLPDGLTYTGASGTGWVCNAVGQVVTCSHAAPLGADESSVVTIDVSVDPTGPSTITNEVVVSYPDDDDPSNNSASGTGTVDRAPHTSGDTATTGENSPVTIEVTDNDSGGDGTLTVTGHTDPSNGAVTCTASECTYTPDTGYSGSDTFDYTLTDADGDAATGTVTVTVTPAPPLPTTTTTVAPTTTTVRPATTTSTTAAPPATTSTTAAPPPTTTTTTTTAPVDAFAAASDPGAQPEVLSVPAPPETPPGAPATSTATASKPPGPAAQRPAPQSLPVTGAQALA